MDMWLRSWRSVSARVLAGALCFSVGQPTVAQDGSEGASSRTPESANRFLFTIFSQDDAGDVDYDVMTKDGGIVDDNYAAGDQRIVFGRLDALTLDGQCKSIVRIQNAKVSDPKTNWPIGTFERAIDWGKVDKVEKTTVTVTTGENVRKLSGIWLTMRNGWQKISLSSGSEADRDRAIFAVEFLRQGCAAGKDTGF